MARSDKRSRITDLGRPEITELEFGRTTHRVAEVEPMDVDGVRTMTVGTIIWGVIAIALLPFWGNLQDQGRTWWLWTAIAGLGLGLVGIEYCKRRRDALQQSAAEKPARPAAPVETLPPAAEVAETRVTPEVVEDRPAPQAPGERPVGRRRRN